MDSGRGLAGPGTSRLMGCRPLTDALRADYPFLNAAWAARLIRAYGTEATVMLGDAKEASDLGEDFGATLTAREVAWLMDKEYARSAEDVVWRRNKLGLRLNADQIAQIDQWMGQRIQAQVA